jgi:hypothetical protein
MGAIGFTLLLSEYFQGKRVTLDGTFGMLKRSYGHFINIGLVSLGLTQFIQYLCGCDNKVGLLLRYGDKIFYVYAFLGVWQEVGQAWFVATGKMGGDSSWQLSWFIFTLPVMLLYKVAKALILIGLGLFLKQLIAVIKESRLKNINQ